MPSTTALIWSMVSFSRPLCRPSDSVSRPLHSDSLFHEVFVLFGFLAGITERLELVSGVIILPQRQTVLVAKQAAEIDVLSGGRLRLGVGVGWNEVEYTGLNENFRNRGRRCEEKIAVMRALWTEEVIDYEGRWHRIPDAGINPLPVQRPIPIWIGGYVAATMDRIGRIGDGWFPQSQVGEFPGAHAGQIPWLHPNSISTAPRPLKTARTRSRFAMLCCLVNDPQWHHSPRNLSEFLRRAKSGKKAQAM